MLIVQRASRWEYGDSFFFVDYLADGGEDGFNDREFYGEWYPTLSLGRLFGRRLSPGPSPTSPWWRGSTPAATAES